MKSQKRTICQRVRLLRTCAGFTQKELAEAASLSVETVQRLERTGMVSAKTISAVSRALRVDPTELSRAGEPMVIACMSEKGGVGRTTLTFNLSVLAASLGHSVCAVQVGEYDPIGRQCRVERHRGLPELSSCWLPDPKVVEDWLKGSRAFSHIFIDGTRYRPEMNKVLIAQSDLILVPITNLAMEEAALDILMDQIAEQVPLRDARILLVFSQSRINESEYADDLAQVERRYGRPFPSVRITQRNACNVAENGGLRGAINTPVLTPWARHARKACQELAEIWCAADQEVRMGRRTINDSDVGDANKIHCALVPVRSRRPPMSDLERALRHLARTEPPHQPTPN